MKLEKNLDLLRKELYASHEPKLCHVEPVDIDAQGNVTEHVNDSGMIMSTISPLVQTSRHTELPPIGVFSHTSVKLHQTVYAMRSSLLSPWGKGSVKKVSFHLTTDIMTDFKKFRSLLLLNYTLINHQIKEKAETLYVVRFDTPGKSRTFPLKYLAYAEPSLVQLAVGSRVIAQYIEDKNGKAKPSPPYYAGVIAEAPKNLNSYRYLVFFDDGYAQYCTHEQVS